MKISLTLAALLVFGMGISGCSGDNNEVNVEIMQNNPENFMPELSPEQKAEMDRQNQVSRNRGWLDLRPKDASNDEPGKDAPPSSD